jgi:hypothetical protein
MFKNSYQRKYDKTGKALYMIKWRDMGVIMRPEQDFERDSSSDGVGRIQNFTSPAIPLENGLWRIWYSAYPDEKYQNFNIAYAEGIPGGEMRRYAAKLCSGQAEQGMLSIGNLPDGWRPIQPVLINLPDGTYRLYFWAHAPGVVRYLCAESYNGKQFNVINANSPCLYHPNDRAVEKKYKGTEGLTLVHKTNRGADEAAAPEHLICNDATNVYMLPDNTFELYTAQLIPIPEDSPAYIEHDNLKGMIRVIERRTSTDGITWSKPQIVIKPDSADPADLQFYFLSVTYVDDMRLGFLGHYRVIEQTMDLELCYSKDGINWHRPFRKPCFPRNLQKDGLYGVYAPHSIVKYNSLYYLFYTGTNQTHNKTACNGPREINIRFAITDSLDLPIL